MPQSLAELLDLLDLEEIEVGLFRARQPDTALQRVFGGQVLAQAVTARTDRRPSTRSALAARVFPAPRSHGHPIIYDVEAVRDGGSFSPAGWSRARPAG